MLIFFVYGIHAPCLSASFVLCCKWSNVGERSSGCFVSPARRRVLRAHRQDLRERYLCTLRTPRTTTRLCLGFLGAGSSCRRNKNTSSFCSLSYEKARPRKDRLYGLRRGRRLWLRCFGLLAPPRRLQATHGTRRHSTSSRGGRDDDAGEEFVKGKMSKTTNNAAPPSLLICACGLTGVCPCSSTLLTLMQVRAN